MTKYCLPIIKKTKEEVMSMIYENPDYDFYEIWLGYIEDLDADFAWKLSEQFNGKLIFLFRKQNLEKSDIEKELKEKIIKIIESSDNLIDFDINDGSWGLNYIKENKLTNKTIASFHNYKETPDYDSLVKTLDEMEKYGPEIIKFSTFCNDPEDGVKLLSFLLKIKQQKKKFIVLGMGEEGVIVRIYGALWGNEFNFAPVNKEDASAPGQLTKFKLEGLLNQLKNLEK